MIFPFYLAMTAGEFAACPPPPKVGWMACHFSCYGLGLSNLPPLLPEASMIILNDRTPVCGHSPEKIIQELKSLLDTQPIACILLDFQRPDNSLTKEIVQTVVAQLPCPVGVSEIYAKDVDCPVFLPPIPPDCPPETYLAPWQQREIWLEMATDGLLLSITKDGCNAQPLPPPKTQHIAFPESSLFCHYEVSVTEKAAQFTLYRTQEDITALLQHLNNLGVTQAVGLYQQFRDFTCL